LIGVLCAIAFLTKQNSIGVVVAIVLYLIVSRLWARQLRTLLRALLVIALGVLSVFLLLLTFFVATGAFEAFWDAAFTYNFVYVSSSLSEHFEGSLAGLRLLRSTGLTQLALIGWSAGLTLLIFRSSCFLWACLAKPLSIITWLYCPFFPSLPVSLFG
jgi:multisubunit Na+/H+ antiporter MnhB subunit